MTSYLRRIKPTLIINALVLLMAFYGIYRAVNKAGIAAEYSLHREGKIQISGLKKHTGPLQAGDIIDSVDGFKVQRIEDIEYICDAYVLGDLVSVQITRNGSEQIEKIELQRFYTKTFCIQISLIGLLFFILGTFVLSKLPKKDEAFIYNWLCMSMVIMITTTWGRLSTLPFGIDHIVRIAFSSAYAFTPALFVHFSYIFPTGKPRLFKNFMPILYSVAVILALWQSVTFLLSLNLSLMDWFHQLMTALNSARIFMTGCILFGIGNFFHAYFIAQLEMYRRKLLWIILGLAVGPFVSILFWQIPQALFSRGIIPEEIIMLFLALSPVSFSIAILRYRLLDINLIFRRSSVYFVAVSGLIIIYAIVVGTAAAVVTYLGIFTLKASLISSAIAAVIIAIMFEPVKKRVQNFIDRKFFRVKYNYRIAQNRFRSSINQNFNINNIIEFTVQELEDLLHPSSIAFYLRSDNEKHWYLIEEKNWKNKDDSLIKLLATEYLKCTQIISLPEYLEADIDFLEANAEVFNKNQIALAVSCKEKRQSASGFLVLGQKKSSSLFSQEDIDLLLTISSHVGLAIEHIRLQQNLILEQAEAQRLDELNKLKSFFVSSVSHELQTPLTSIRMFAELLRTKKEISAEEKNEYLEIIEGESERLTRLINNVLDYSRIERGAKDYTFTDVNIKELIKKVLHSMMFQLKQHGFKTITEISEEDLIIKADGDALHEALVNLIANSIKYSTSQKELKLSVKAENDQIRFSVADKGIGISEEDQKNVFDMFYRSHDKYVQSSGGAGLGLTIVNHIVEAHGGIISLQSHPNKGSTFTISIPVEPTP